MTTDKGHGRIERRELWVVDALDLGVYLHDDFNWPGIRQVGWVQRSRRRLRDRTWRQIETHTWISSVAPDQAAPATIAALLRGHWAIENDLHWVRDNTWDEDRLHGRACGANLAALRNTAINLIRCLGFAYIPDGRRAISAYRDCGLSILRGALQK